MKRACFFWALIFLVQSVTAEVITMTAKARCNGSDLISSDVKELVLKEHQWMQVLDQSRSGIARIDMIKDGMTNTMNASGINLLTPPVMIAGPALIRLTHGGCDFPVFITIRIETDTFPPDRTVVIPEGTSARIALECSTNLTEWVEVFSTNHTSVPMNKFFRIKAERGP